MMTDSAMTTQWIAVDAIWIDTLRFAVVVVESGEDSFVTRKFLSDLGASRSLAQIT